MNEEETKENVEKTYTDPVTGKFIPGNPGGGRPKGSFSIKEKVRQYLEEHPEDMDKFIEHFAKENRELAWQMLEGRPKQDHDVDLGFKPIPLDPNVYKDESISEDQIIETEN